MTLKEMKMRALAERLIQFQGNRTHTAKSLQVSVRWIRDSIKIMEEYYPELAATIPESTRFYNKGDDYYGEFEETLH